MKQFFQQIIFACSRKKKLIFKGNIFVFNPNIFNKKYFYSTHENTILNNWLSKIVFKILLSFTNMQLSAKWFKIIVLRLQILFRKSWSDANTRRRVGGKGGIMSLASLCCKNLKCVWVFWDVEKKVQYKLLREISENPRRKTCARVLFGNFFDQVGSTINVVWVFE